MAQQTQFPLRYGLTLSRGENLQATEVFSEGGLDLTQSIVENKPGYASELINFEANLKGGYRRINGFAPLFLSQVPGIGPVVGISGYTPTSFIAARQSAGDPTKYNVYKGSVFGWTQLNAGIDLNFSVGTVVNSTQYNFSGTPIITFTDGLNNAYKYDGTVLTSLDAVGSPDDPRWAIAFSGYLFLGDYSSNSAAITISAPLDDEDYSPVDGSAEFVIGDTEVTGFAIWRAQLIIFCRNSIWKIIGNSTDYTAATPFQLSPITRRVGCIEGRTIQECDGDILFLAQDGIRTISGTINIGDTEIASISRPIQAIVGEIDPITTPCFSAVVHRKTQYRLFYPDPSLDNQTCKGVVGAVRRFRDGHEAWEWGELKGFKPACTDSRYLNDGNEYVVMGGYDGYVYRLDQGSTFSTVESVNPYLYDNGVLYNTGAVYNNITFGSKPIGEVYTTVPMELGDYGIRKALQRATIYYYAEGGDLILFLHQIYDYKKQGVIQPRPILLSLNSSTVRFDNDVLYNSGALYDTVLDPVARKSIQGSGFVMQLRFNSLNSDPYVIQGFYLEYFPAGRR